MKRTIFLTIIFLSINIFAQYKPLSRKDYNLQKSELLKQKDILLKEKNSLNSEIGELIKQFTYLKNNRRDICRNYFLKKYGNKIGSRVADGRIWKGMTISMLKDSWGKPDKVTRQKRKWGLFTQLYYGKTTFFFKNKKLTDWEEKK
jgi:hypothetical protein